MAEEIIEGRNAVLEALRSGRPIGKILVAAGSRPGPLQELRRLARERGIPVQEVDRTRLDRLSGTGKHQGVIARALAREYATVEEILQIARERGEDPFLLLLDGIEDPHNLGALIRTAECAGVHGVVVPKRRAAGLTAAVGRASAGALEYMAVAQVPNLARCIEELKGQGIWVVGADPQGEQVYTAADLTGPIAVVIGGEGKGIGRLVKEKCDFLVQLPMRGRISSLNASVAGSLLMYEILRQRAAKGAE
ncbi:MAG TPA: 23S rRNA (guanosine(2251)-2'-O)-methyltransferase RlmB [Firmicutes bacterium]|nr:23S rRNA (guanosine(2251)-2'-O)-methyltransferase RlmB [Bacillota bacterium]